MTAPASAAVSVALIGPTHPLKGGVAAHTTELAHQLAQAGHEVQLISWSRMYPSALYPGEQYVADGRPEVTPFPATSRPLAWNRPDSWVRVGRRMAALDLVILVHVVPAVIPAYLAMLAALPRGERRPRVVVLAHNVLPHEPRRADERLVRALFARADMVLVHTAQQASLAGSLGADLVRTAALPPHLPGGEPAARAAYAGPARLLALGLVRPYKGIEDLIDALAEVPGPTLTVAGEAWGDAGEAIARAAAQPGAAGRVTIVPGYVPAADLAELLAAHDILALTYRTATASQNALLAHKHGLAVLATDVGSFPKDVRDGVDGALVPAGDRAALVAVLRRLADPLEVERLRAGVGPPDLSGPWANYVAALETLAALDVPPRPRRSSGWRDQAKGALATLRPRVEVSAGDLPDWLSPTDILGISSEADDARELARELGLPRRGDKQSGWAALGGLAAVLRVRDDGRRTALIVDQSGPRSPFASWARAIGFAPVEFPAGDDLDVDPGSIDVLTRLHPSDADAGELGDLFGQATWALRPGGLLITTLALGPATAKGAVGPADLRGVLAHADNAGLRLIGDLDGDLTLRMRRAAGAAADPDAAYGLVRLTWRRR